MQLKPVEADGLLAGLAAACRALEDRLEQPDDLREGEAVGGAKGRNRSSVRNPCAAVTSAVW